MRLGPVLVKKCNACSKLISHVTLASGNTFGARLWTDAKMDAPMMPDLPPLVLCPHCRTPVWLNELEELPRQNSGSHEEAYPESPGCQSLEVDDYYAMLTGERLAAEKERYVRLRAWWAGNDLRRGSEAATPLTDREKQNIQALLTFMDDADDNDRLMKADILRELGQMDQARAQLETVMGENLEHIVKFMIVLIERGDTFVQELPSPRPDR